MPPPILTIGDHQIRIVRLVSECPTYKTRTAKRTHGVLPPANIEVCKASRVKADRHEPRDDGYSYFVAAHGVWIRQGDLAEHGRHECGCGLYAGEGVCRRCRERCCFGCHECERPEHEIE